jgi:hypothetical protein
MPGTTRRSIRVVVVMTFPPLRRVAGHTAAAQVIGTAPNGLE